MYQYVIGIIDPARWSGRIDLGFPTEPGGVMTYGPERTGGPARSVPRHRERSEQWRAA